jgi:hypothetical protein
MRLSRVADLSGMPPASAPAMLSAMAWPALTLIPAPMPPACVSRHRIHRFKTFTNPVALHILLGFNGLSGPNGCGKSNVVNALRWAMGEGNAAARRWRT